MRVTRPLLSALLVVGVAYIAYPYVTLFRLGMAMRSADAATLESLVDWPSVREGIKEDICDDVADASDSPNSGTTLPPFGASFMRGIASNTIDQKVTPQAIVAAVSTLPDQGPQPQQRGADVRVNWAFFDGPTSFTVSLQPHGMAEPVRMEMELQHGAWHIDRVWLPPELLTNAPART